MQMFSVLFKCHCLLLHFYYGPDYTVARQACKVLNCVGFSYLLGKEQDKRVPLCLLLQGLE